MATGCAEHDIVPTQNSEELEALIVNAERDWFRTPAAHCGYWRSSVSCGASVSSGPPPKRTIERVHTRNVT